VNRRRENAYAASAPRNTVPIAATIPMKTVFTNQDANGRVGRLNSSM